MYIPPSLVENANATCGSCRLPGGPGHSLLRGDDVPVETLKALCLHTQIGLQLDPKKTEPILEKWEQSPPPATAGTEQD